METLASDLTENYRSPVYCNIVLLPPRSFSSAFRISKTLSIIVLASWQVMGIRFTIDQSKRRHESRVMSTSVAGTACLDTNVREASPWI